MHSVPLCMRGDHGVENILLEHGWNFIMVREEDHIFGGSEHSS